MPDRRALEARITNLKKISQMTSAMRQMASMNLRKIQGPALSGKLYQEALAEIVHKLVLPSDLEVYFAKGEESQGKLAVLILNDQGLAGSYFSDLRQALIRYQEDFSADLIAIGSKAKTMALDLKINFLQVLDYSVLPKYQEAKAIVEAILALYPQYNSVDIISQRFYALARQKVEITSFLPLITEGDKPKKEVDLEPSRSQILERLIPLYLRSQIWQLLKEARASEQVQRMLAMAESSDNAEEMVFKLEQENRRLRQAQITQDIIELVDGAK